METLECYVDDLIFENKENGYTICSVFNEELGEFVAVGCMPYTNIGDKLKLSGTWVTHAEYGEQFKVEYYEKPPLEAEDDILLFLSSGAIRGIREKTAMRLVEKFGKKTLEVIRDEPNKLTQLKGINEEKAIAIHNDFIKQQGMQKIIVFFSQYGISTSLAYKVYQTFGEESVEKMKENPYLLCRQVEGIGFRTADKIAFAMGYDQSSQARVESGVLFGLSEAVGKGHTYLPRDILTDYVSQLLQVPAELVQNALMKLLVEGALLSRNIDGVQAIYLPAFYAAENAVAQKLLQLSVERHSVNEGDLAIRLEEIQKELEITLAENQLQAIRLAMAEGCLVITGGPGTGKTTIINTIIRILKSQNLKVDLCAPTGRAAKRMGEVCHCQAKTVHRLLKLEYSTESGRNEFTHDETNPLKSDVIIVDEVSMMDVLLMNSLLKAMKKGARLILVGDADQLPSVGAGDVLRDIIASGAVEVVALKEIFRQAEQSLIVVNAHKINRGEYPQYKNTKDSDFFFLSRPGYAQGVQEILGLVKERLPGYLKADGPSSIQVLTPVRKGEVGVENLNQKLQQALNPPDHTKKELSRFHGVLREGDKVMQIKNNYELEYAALDCDGKGIFNGELGYITKIRNKDGCMDIVFDGDKETQYPNELLDDIELAYAMTVHKSQGSEFPAVVMPVYPVSNLLLNRNLFYTAVTRARQLVVLVGRYDVVQYMTENNYEAKRYSGLQFTLRQLTEQLSMVQGEKK